MFTILSGCSSVKLSPCFSQMLWSTQQVSAIFLLSSSLRSFHFRRHLHRPFKSPKIHLYNRLCTGEPVIVGLLFMGSVCQCQKRASWANSAWGMLDHLSGNVQYHSHRRSLCFAQVIPLGPPTNATVIALGHHAHSLDSQHKHTRKDLCHPQLLAGQ